MTEPEMPSQDSLLSGAMISAIALHHQYSAYVEAGFTPAQALQLTMKYLEVSWQYAAFREITQRDGEE